MPFKCVLQKRIIRLILNKDKRPVKPGPFATTNPLFFKLEILEVNKCLNIDTPNNFHDWFKLNCVFTSLQY